MTVGQLKELIKNCNDDQYILVEDSEGFISDIINIDNKYQYDKENDSYCVGIICDHLCKEF